MKTENIIEKNKCTGCMACKNICHKNAILIVEDENGFQYPKIKKEKCINCGMCVKICPVINKLKTNQSNIDVYSCKNKNENERMKSSSGGIFSLIAKYILKQNGVVFGAKFNENFEVIHDYIDNEENLDDFRGSKYLQSQINDCFRKVKKFLQQDRKVLFTGTPCQVEGLLAYLGGEHKKLYTQDIICHGVPSQKVWKKYLEYKRRQKGEDIIKINFRRKDILGWNNYQINYVFNKQEENIHHNDDPYMKIFLRNLCLRDSCYNCSFKKIVRNSDITLGDFWGIEHIRPEINDERGISALIINTEKGKEIFENIKNKIEFTKERIEDIIKFNSCLSVSTNYNNKREEFFKDLEETTFEELIEKYL